MKIIMLLLRPAMLVLILLGLPFFGGCAAENVRQGLYEGVRTRNNLQSSPAERAARPESPDYPEYERLRKEQGYAK